MDFSALAEKLKNEGLEFAENEPMSRHTSFRIGGPAAIMIFPRTADETEKALQLAQGYETLLFGNGSNLLAGDGRLEIAAIKTCRESEAEYLGDGKIKVPCSMLLSKAAAFALKLSLTGMEFAAGIPGTLGGAIFMNAGAYGGEMKDIVLQTEYLTKDLERKLISNEEHDFGYRKSVFSGGEGVVLSSVLQLQEGDSGEIRGKMDLLAKKRKASQPLDLPSAGSTFKRPAGGYAAALIEQAGLKGVSVGGAMVSPKHSGFVVNTGGATCEDVRRLMDIIIERVYAFSGITLEPEVRFVGC